MDEQNEKEGEKGDALQDTGQADDESPHVNEPPQEQGHEESKNLDVHSQPLQKSSFARKISSSDGPGQGRTRKISFISPPLQIPFLRSKSQSKKPDPTNEPNSRQCFLTNPPAPAFDEGAFPLDAVKEDSVLTFDHATERRKHLGEMDKLEETHPFLSPHRISVTSRHSVISRPSITSRPSFIGGITGLPSMVSIKSTISKANVALYPEKGSFIASSLSRSLAEFPALAKKAYIVTQVLAAISVSMGSMAVGFSAAYTSPALASLRVDNTTFSVTTEQESWIGSLLPLSALTGSIFGGYLIDSLGRKMVICLCGPPFLAAYLTIGSAVNVWMLYVGRAIAGLCVGLLSLTLPVYLSETIQPEIRGTLGLLPTTVGNSGILVCYFLGSFLNWSWLAYAGAVIPIIFASMMFFVPETPRWYISKGEITDARNALQWLRGSEAEVEFELDAIHENFQRSSDESSKIKDLFKMKFLKAFGLALGLMMFQQLSGINAVIFYTASIFQYAGSTIDENISSIIIGIVNLLSTFVANVLIDRLGRKKLLYISDVLMVLSLCALGFYFGVRELAKEGNEGDVSVVIVQYTYWLPLVSLMAYVVAFSLGWGPIPWLFMGEALPAKIRGTAASLVTAFNWSCTFVITKTFVGLIDSIGAHGVFFMFAGVMFVGLFFTIFLIPETKGKTLEEIEAEIAGQGKPELRRYPSDISGIVIR